jgi:hypothetical protein
MKISDILRMAADAFDGRAPGAAPDTNLQNPAELEVVEIPGQEPVEVVANVDYADTKHDPAGTTPSGNDKEPEDLFIPPLQQKQELLKKAVGVENIYDDGRPGEEGDANADAPTPEEEDVLEKIKRMAGVPVAAVQELSNDEVFDD